MRNEGKAELLAPAGDMKKLRAAVIYGADAVYLAGKNFGMRSASGNFSDAEITDAVSFCHSNGVRVYVTVNVMPRTDEYDELEKHISFLSTSGVDAVIVSDIGVFMTVREIAPELPVHISTQASTVSARSCTEWYRLGAKRVVLARELTMEEIRQIRLNTPEELELEAFVHGAMCISYSGRCLLSNYFTGRDANHGSCAQPCRWMYDEISLTEKNRKDDGEVLEAEQTEDGTFFMSSKDTSMIEHIADLESSGITSYKIEGRVKSAYYTAVVTNTYRMALDAYRKDPSSYSTDPEWLNELDSVSHREYGTGFFYQKPGEGANTVTQHGYIREKAYIGTAISDSVPTGSGTYLAQFEEVNKISSGQIAEVLSPGKTGRPFMADRLYNENGDLIESAPHPGMIFRAEVPFEVKAGDILRGSNLTSLN